MCRFNSVAETHKWMDTTRIFNMQGSVYRWYIRVYIQQDATLHSLFISGNCSTCFGRYLHPSSGAHTTLSTATGTCQTGSATCRYRGRVGTSVPTLPRWRQVAVPV